MRILHVHLLKGSIPVFLFFSCTELVNFLLTLCVLFIDQSVQCRSWCIPISEKSRKMHTKYIQIRQQLVLPAELIYLALSILKNLLVLKMDEHLLEGPFCNAVSSKVRKSKQAGQFSQIMQSKSYSDISFLMRVIYRVVSSEMIYKPYSCPLHCLSSIPQLHTWKRRCRVH